VQPERLAKKIASDRSALKEKKWIPHGGRKKKKGKNELGRDEEKKKLFKQTARTWLAPKRGESNSWIRKKGSSSLGAGGTLAKQMPWDGEGSHLEMSVVKTKKG